MASRRYRAIDVNSFKWSKLVDKVRGGRWVIGVDIAKRVQFASLVGDDKTVYATVKWVQPRDSWLVLDALRWLRDEHQCRVEVAMGIVGYLRGLASTSA